MQQQTKKKAEDLEGQVTQLTNKTHEQEAEVARLEVALQQKQRQTKELPMMRERLERFEAKQATYELDFARRLANDVLGTTLEELWMATRGQRPGAGEIDLSKPHHSKAVLAVLISKLKALPLRLEELETPSHARARQLACMHTDSLSYRSVANFRVSVGVSVGPGSDSVGLQVASRASCT